MCIINYAIVSNGIFILFSFASHYTKISHACKTHSARQIATTSPMRGIVRFTFAAAAAAFSFANGSSHGWVLMQNLP